MGTKVNSCRFAELYSGISGRVNSLRIVDENRLDDTLKIGRTKAGKRQVILTPDRVLSEMKSGDYLSIPWGTKPNLWCPRGVPQNLGPYIWVKTPRGNKLLKWEQDRFVSDSLVLVKIDSGWEVSGEIELELSSIVTSNWPMGYDFQAITGPIMDFEITKIEPELDEHGRLCWYGIEVETKDSDHWYLQE